MDFPRNKNGRLMLFSKPRKDYLPEIPDSPSTDPVIEGMFHSRANAYYGYSRRQLQMVRDFYQFRSEEN